MNEAGLRQWGVDLREGPVVVESPPNTLGMFQDAFFRYIPPSDPLEALEPSSGAGSGPVSDPLEEGHSRGSKNAGNPHEQGILGVLGDRKGETGKKGAVVGNIHLIHPGLVVGN